eukprot:g3348.t2
MTVEITNLNRWAGQVNAQLHHPEGSRVIQRLQAASAELEENLREYRRIDSNIKAHKVESQLGAFNPETLLQFVRNQIDQKIEPCRDDVKELQKQLHKLDGLEQQTKKWVPVSMESQHNEMGSKIAEMMKQLQKVGGLEADLSQHKEQLQRISGLQISVPQKELAGTLRGEVEHLATKVANLEKSLQRSVETQNALVAKQATKQQQRTDILERRIHTQEQQLGSLQASMTKQTEEQPQRVESLEAKASMLEEQLQKINGFEADAEAQGKLLERLSASVASQDAKHLQKMESLQADVTRQEEQLQKIRGLVANAATQEGLQQQLDEVKKTARKLARLSNAGKDQGSAAESCLIVMARLTAVETMVRQEVLPELQHLKTRIADRSGRSAGRAFLGRGVCAKHGAQRGKMGQLVLGMILFTCLILLTLRTLDVERRLHAARDATPPQSVEQRSKLLKTVQLTLHPDKGGTNEAQILASIAGGGPAKNQTQTPQPHGTKSHTHTHHDILELVIWLKEWLKDHLEWFFEPHQVPEKLKKQYQADSEEDLSVEEVAQIQVFHSDHWRRHLQQQLEGPPQPAGSSRSYMRMLFEDVKGACERKFFYALLILETQVCFRTKRVSAERMTSETQDAKEVEVRDSWWVWRVVASKKWVQEIDEEQNVLKQHVQKVESVLNQHVQNVDNLTKSNAMELSTKLQETQSTHSHLAAQIKNVDASCQKHIEDLNRWVSCTRQRLNWVEGGDMMSQLHKGFAKLDKGLETIDQKIGEYNKIQLDITHKLTIQKEMVKKQLQTWDSPDAASTLKRQLSDEIDRKIKPLKDSVEQALEKLQKIEDGQKRLERIDEIEDDMKEKWTLVEAVQTSVEIEFPKITQLEKGMQSLKAEVAGLKTLEATMASRAFVQTLQANLESQLEELKVKTSCREAHEDQQASLPHQLQKQLKKMEGLEAEVAMQKEQVEKISGRLEAEVAAQQGLQQQLDKVKTAVKKQEQQARLSNPGTDPRSAAVESDLWMQNSNLPRQLEKLKQGLLARLSKLEDALEPLEMERLTGMERTIQQEVLPQLQHLQIRIESLGRGPPQADGGSRGSSSPRFTQTTQPQDRGLGFRWRSRR